MSGQGREENCAARPCPSPKGDSAPQGEIGEFGIHPQILVFLKENTALYLIYFGYALQ